MGQYLAWIIPRTRRFKFDKIKSIGVINDHTQMGHNLYIYMLIQQKALNVFSNELQACMNALISIAWIIVRIRRFKFFHMKLFGAQMAMP